MQQATRIFSLSEMDQQTLRETGSLQRPDGLALKYEPSIPELDGVEGVSWQSLPPKYEKSLKRHRRKTAKESRRRNRK